MLIDVDGLAPILGGIVQVGDCYQVPEAFIISVRANKLELRFSALTVHGFWSEIFRFN